MKTRLAAVAACTAAMLSTACSHRALSFFFDGVPPKSAQPAPAPGTDAAAATVGPHIGLEHGPYAAKLCDACHSRQATNNLVAPPDQLCGRCHALSLDKQFVHGPLASGGCLVCHDPHASKYPHLLVAESKTFCLRCHESQAVAAVGAHQDLEAGAQCTDCHDAHMSDKQYLLR